MTLSKIALFAFGLATVFAIGFQNANAAPRNGYWSTSIYNSSVEAARFDRAKGYPQGY